MDPVIETFLRYTRPYNARIEKIILFGSRARGKEAPWSDYDVLLLVDKKDRKMIDKFYDGVMECLLEHGCDVSLKIYTKERWHYLRRLKTPFSENVTREGIEIGPG